MVSNLQPAKNLTVAANSTSTETPAYEFNNTSQQNNLLLQVAEVNHSNIEAMMNSLLVNVLENFDSKLPSLLEEVSESQNEIDDSSEEPEEVTTQHQTKSVPTTTQSTSKSTITTTTTITTKAKFIFGHHFIWPIPNHNESFHEAA